MSKFAALASNLTDAFNMTVLSPITGAVMKDGEGREAFISFLSPDSEAGRKIDRAQTQASVRRARLGRGNEEIDASELLHEKLAALTKGWHLVDLDGNVIDVPFSPDNARELWSDPGMEWLTKQAAIFLAAPANFMRRSSTS